eukprot:gene6914-7691_t
MAGREDGAQFYLNQHRVPELLNNITASLVYDRPDDPKQYIIDFLKRLQDAKSVKMDYPCIFDESNVSSLFGMLDPSSKGTITQLQYKTAMENLGVTNYNRAPEGSESDKITLDVFQNEAMQGLSASSATFSST